MNVYVLEEHFEYEGSEFHGVFFTTQDAMEWINSQWPKFKWKEHNLLTTSEGLVYSTNPHRGHKITISRCRVQGKNPQE